MKEDHPDYNKTRLIGFEDTSDYQNLMEGKTEVICKNEETLHSTNITALIRDLYRKVYLLEKMVESKSIKE